MVMIPDHQLQSVHGRGCNAWCSRVIATSGYHDSYIADIVLVSDPRVPAHQYLCCVSGRTESLLHAVLPCVALQDLYGQQRLQPCRLLLLQWCTNAWVSG